LLKETIVEKKGLINRESLLDISSRSRKKQLKLAEFLKIKNFLTPAGGCILTEIEFGKKLKKLFKINLKCNEDDIELLKLGRHFFEKKYQIVIGRNEEENKKIEKLAKKGDILVEIKNYPGPLTLIRNYGKRKISEKILKIAKSLTQRHSPKARNEKDIKFKITS